MEMWVPYVDDGINTDQMSYNPLVDPHSLREPWQTTEWLVCTTTDSHLKSFSLKVSIYDHQFAFIVKRRKSFPYNFEEAITTHCISFDAVFRMEEDVVYPRRWSISERPGSQRWPRWTLNNLCSYFPTQTLPSLKVCKDGWMFKV